MSTPSKSLFACLTIALIFGAQLFGMGAGYICECHDEPLITTAAHCHSDAKSCQGEDDCKNSPVTHHEPHQDQLEASPLAAPVSAPTPFVAILSPHVLEFFCAFSPPAIAPAVCVRYEPLLTPLPNAQLVAHCMVLLV
jgi:hypothetical protein